MLKAFATPDANAEEAPFLGTEPCSGRPLPQPALSDRPARRPARRDKQSAALRVELPRPAVRLGLLHLPPLRQPLVIALQALEALAGRTHRHPATGGGSDLCERATASIAGARVDPRVRSELRTCRRCWRPRRRYGGCRPRAGAGGSRRHPHSLARNPEGSPGDHGLLVPGVCDTDGHAARCEEIPAHKPKTPRLQGFRCDAGERPKGPYRVRTALQIGMFLAPGQQADSTKRASPSYVRRSPVRRSLLWRRRIATTSSTGSPRYVVAISLPISASSSQSS